MAGNRRDIRLEDDPLWYKDAIIYEVHVRAFYDSNGDGLGDFEGLTAKLDYLQDLGVTAIWVLPFCPSPWRDDGYDISDYTDVHPAYGALRDFQTFLKEAHHRGLRVITELVLNHTSDQHVWFQRARHSPPGSKWRDFYVWNDTPEKYKEARIIFKDTEPSNWSWDPVAKAYYWHRFFSHQPDLNYDNPSVRRLMTRVVDYWLRMGVDGLRLDAVPYLYEREATSCENLPETHAFLRELRRHVDSRFRNRMLLAEANQWPEDAIHYFAAGDEAHMNFHFPLMPRLFMASRMEDRFPLVDILQQTPQIPESCQWALFLRNHDELTLEMVTDEERDYMYRVYASDPQMRINLGIRRRLAPLLGHDRRRIELMNAILLSMPGTPVIYYGDEIGMGDNIYLGDRNGVRTPMQWSPDRNAGFSRTNPQRLYLPAIIDPECHYEAINVESQLNNPASLLWWMKRIIALRKDYKSFGRGTIEFLHPENRKVLAFVRRYQDSAILVVANLSRFVQAAELDLSQYKGMAPVELFGHSDFPGIGDQPYFITLAPYGFYWFALEPQRAILESVSERPAQAAVPALAVSSWDDALDAKARGSLERILPGFLRTRRWFLGKARKIRAAQIADVVPVTAGAYLLLVLVEYSEGDPETYQLPLSVARGEVARRMETDLADTAVARLQGPDGEQGLLYSAVWDKASMKELLASVARRRRFKGESGEVIAAPSPEMRRDAGAVDGLEPIPLTVDQANSSIAFGDGFMMKLFRKLEHGVNPQLEIGYYLTEIARFPNAPKLAGALEYRAGGQTMTLGVVERFVRNQGNAWGYTLDALSRYFEAALTHRERVNEEPKLDPPSLSLLDQEPPPLALELIGSYLESVRLIGRRLAELHMALAGNPNDPAFAPEPFTDFYRQSLYHGMLGIVSRSLLDLRRRLRHIPEAAQADGRRVIQLEADIRKRFEAIRDRRITALRIRNHGDFHLGELLYTGRDFCIIDFEGRPIQSISERRIKRSPLRDVASMLRSFHYASHAALYGAVPGVIPRAEDRPALEIWARFWNRWVGLAFFREYMAAADPAPFLPKAKDGLAVLTFTFLLEKAVTELGYELAHRVDWVQIPLQGILQLMETPWPP